MANIQYYDVILKPVVTEKSMNAMSEKMFEGTEVKTVNTMNLDGKKKRRGYTVGRTAKTKKAIVTLTENSKDIEIFEGL